MTDYILIVEDNPDLANLERRHLERAGLQVVTANSTNSWLLLAQYPIGLILVDNHLAAHPNGLAFLENFSKAGHDVPVLRITGPGEKAAALDQLGMEVHDLVTKSLAFLDLLPETVKRVLQQVRGEQEKMDAQAQLKNLLDTALDAILGVNAAQVITLCNPAAERLFQYEAAAIVGQPLQRLLPDWPFTANGGGQQVNGNGFYEMRGQRADGREIPLEIAWSSAGEGQATLIARDIRGRHQAQEVLREENHIAETLQKIAALLGAELNPDRLCQLLVDAAVQTTQAEFAQFFCRMVDDQGRPVFYQAQTFDPEKVNPSPSDETWQQWGDPEVVGKRLIRIADQDAYDQPLPYPRQPLGCSEVPPFRSYLGTPVVSKSGKVSGFLHLGHGQPNAFLERHVRLLTGVVAQGVLTLDNARLYLQSRAAQEHIRQQAALLDAANDAIWAVDPHDRLCFWNRGAELLYGWTKAEAVGQPAGMLLMPGNGPQFGEVCQTVRHQGNWTGELKQVPKDGGALVVASRWSLLRGTDHWPEAILVINTDITEKKRLEGQLLRTQRLESLGTLAGGIAHDLNNILAPILMGAELLEKTAHEPAAQMLVDTIQSSAQRGADLVKQVLAFARGTEAPLQTLDVPPLIKEMVHMLRQTFPKSMAIRVRIPADLWGVRGAPTQIHQILMNLCVNARDAMPNGGQILISVWNTLLDKEYVRLNPDAAVGRYVVLNVVDTGTGIPGAIIDKIFDPFFTTKEMGQGTGMGLSVVLGIAKSMGGFINVYSALGCGSQFSVYLPAATSAQNSATSRKINGDFRGTGELVLVVDDEPAIRTLAQAMLESCGYRVITAQDGNEALLVFAHHFGKIKAVVTDMAMPIMDGPATIRAIRQLDPEVRIIAASGYSTVAPASDISAGITAFLPKPFTTEDLLATLHGVLHQ